MPVPTLNELQQWFNQLTDPERVCRLWVRDEIHSGICARAAVGIDPSAGPSGLVCETHKPSARVFVRLRRETENSKTI